MEKKKKLKVKKDSWKYRHPEKYITHYVRYNSGVKLWIPHRYILYSYWFEFIKLAHKEGKKIDWKFYRMWGGKKILEVTFRTWFKKNWVKVLSVKNEYDKGKFPMSSQQVKPDGIRVCIQTYKNKHKENRHIFDLLVKQGLIGDTNTRVGQTINRYRKNADKIVENVCKGIFP